MSRIVRSNEQIAFDVESQSKVCTKCGERKDFKEFRIKSSCKDGRSMVCKKCSTKPSNTNFRSKIEIVNDILLGSKVCCRCGVRKSFEEYYKCSRVSDGRRHFCIDCYKDIYKNSNKKESSARLRYLKSAYSEEEYIIQSLMNKQKGSCAICDISLVTPDSKQSYAIDHNHETGKIRGLLCHSCNRMLGQAKDSTYILQKGIDYLIDKGDYASTWL